MGAIGPTSARRSNSKQRHTAVARHPARAIREGTDVRQCRSRCNSRRRGQDGCGPTTSYRLVIASYEPRMPPSLAKGCGTTGSDEPPCAWALRCVALTGHYSNHSTRDELPTLLRLIRALLDSAEDIAELARRIGH